MTLLPIHDFELSLLGPCLAMSRRGLCVDETRRALMLAALEADRAPTVTEVQRKVLPHLYEGMPRPRLFEQVWTCPCCRNGKGKREACWSCVGFEKKPTKGQLARWVASLWSGKIGNTTITTYVTEEAAATALQPCKVCNGEGQRRSWEFNPASDDQVCIVLYDLIGLPVRTKDGRRTVDEEALKSLLAHDQSGIVAGLLAIRKLDTMCQILERITPGPDGRIRTFYNPAGTETGRFSSAESFLAASTNLQNLPKKSAMLDARFDVRRCIVPSEGMAFVEADLSQAEARVVAALCGDKKLLERWRDDSTFDIHNETAMAALGRPVQTKAEREVLGKRGRHATNYGESWKAYMDSANADADITGLALIAATAKTAIRNIYKYSKLLGPWWKTVEEKLSNGTSLTTMFGRRRMFYGRRVELPSDWLERALDGSGIKDPVLREAIAFEPQSTVADLLNRGMLRWFSEHNGKIGNLVAQVHDSVLLEVPLARVKGAARLLKRCLEESLTINGITFVIPADCKWSPDSWGEMQGL